MPNSDREQNGKTEVFRRCPVILRLRAKNEDGMRRFAKVADLDILPVLLGVFDGLSGAAGVLSKLDVVGSTPITRSQN